MIVFQVFDDFVIFDIILIVFHKFVRCNDFVVFVSLIIDKASGGAIEAVGCLSYLAQGSPCDLR